MKKERKFKNMWLAAGLLALAISLPALPQAVLRAEASEVGNDVVAEGQGFEFTPFWKEEPQQYNSWEISYTGMLSYQYDNPTSKEVVLEAKTSNSKVIELTGEKSKAFRPGAGGFSHLQFQIKGTGAATITVAVDGKEYTQKFYVLPGSVTLNSAKQSSYNTLKLKWTKLEGVSGYQVLQAKAGSDSYRVIKTVNGKDTTSVNITAPWNKSYNYRIQAFLMDGKNQLTGTSVGNYLEATVKKMGSSITAVKKSGSSSLKITWKATKGAVGYKVYRSNLENGSYKCVKTIKSGTATSYTQKVSKGETYFYRLVTVYPIGNSDMSNTMSQMIPKKSAARSDSLSSVSQLSSSGSYAWPNWSHPDTTYYYEKGGKLHMVCAQSDKKLMIYTMDGKGKVTAQKNISLNYDTWGGFYVGPDGNFYVAVGYSNPTESKTKTVIQVIQYSDKWKKKKTASIKGNAANSFVGIYQPFEAGNCRMDLQGSVLYLYTARKMFIHSDGLRHQSNIAFKINTKNMKATSTGDSYVSHSFNQFVKFKDGNLYLADHGDAYPRSLYLQMINNYGKKDQTRKGVSMFELKGAIGNNFTGVTMGGMEVGSKNVMVCGTAHPHKYKIAGVTGSDFSYKKNVYVIMTNRKTGKKTVKWLTSHNPRTTTTEVGETRMVKLTDDRFAILYTTTKDDVSTLNYVVVDNNGKKVYSKTYSNMEFCGSSQPVLSKGSIVWAETYYKSDYSGMDTKMFKIPAVW